MSKHFLAFDLGASSGRAILGAIGDGKLTLTEVHRFPNGPLEREDGIYWDYPALCAELKTGLQKALAVCPALDGVAIDTWGVDYVLFDAKTMAMRRLPYHYRDQRTDGMIAELAKTLPDAELYGVTGIQFMQFNTIYQLAAHRTAHPGELETSRMLPIPDALSYYLSGEISTETTMASTGALLDAQTRDWAWEVLDRLGFPRTLFTPLVAPGSAQACLRPELQKELGCGAIPVFKIAAHDTASAVAAVPATGDKPWCYISAGTWALLGAELQEPIRSEAARQAGFTNESGVARTVRFLTNIMGSWLFQETRRVWNEAGKKLSFADIEKMALSAEPFRYLINPNDASFFAPGDMPARVRQFIVKSGQAATTAEISDAATVRTIYDSLALYFKLRVEALAQLLGTHYERLNIVGGGTKDTLLMQLTADALGFPVLAGPVEATAAGNLVTQAVAAGVLPDFHAARHLIAASLPLVKYEPRAENHAAFAQLARRFPQRTA